MRFMPVPYVRRRTNTSMFAAKDFQSDESRENFPFTLMKLPPCAMAK